MAFFNFPKWPYTDFHRLNLDWVIEAFQAVQGKIDAIAGLTVNAHTLPTGADATVTASGGTGIGDPYSLAFGLPRGLPGESATVDTTTAEYATSTSGVNIPAGGWQGNIPVVPQGYYLWTRLTITFRDVNGVHASQIYTVSRQGIDGEGSVKSVNDVSPDPEGNVTLPAVLYTEQNLTPSERMTAARNIGVKDNENVHYYVNGETGNDSNPGTADAPFRSINPAMNRMPVINTYTPPSIHITGGTFDSYTFHSLTPLNIVIDGNVTFTGSMVFTLGHHTLRINNNLVIKQLITNAGGGLHITGSGTITFNTGDAASLNSFAGSVGVEIDDTVHIVVNSSTVLFQSWGGCHICARNSPNISGTVGTIAFALNSIVILDADPTNLTRTAIANTLWGGRFFMGSQTYPEV